ncbi:UDP-glucuronosyl/UDP-glucosyltransferase protein [Dioscorea alata]|uniref:UDP-glucuronosyl/UDP-glucosyltransferase protein n=1 Tax=Dioscorea alata TaxID=55571 RepID=A0ACB7TXL9_DIOAL|nr:UDP-glucuronosyl/UDP-glucosyltransferase protein [Dioscorea alata]
MGSIAGQYEHEKKPHAVCIPYPAQGHITPMLKLAKLLHSNGFHITFINSEYNHKRLLNSRGPSSLDGLHDFQYKTIPDGLPPSHFEATQDIPSLCQSTMTTCLPFFRQLLIDLMHPRTDSGVPPVTCIIADGVMSFTLDAAVELGIPEFLFWTTSACGFMCYLHYHLLIAKSLAPLKSMEDISNGYLETPVEWIPGMKNMRLRDFPSFIRTTNREDIMINFALHETSRVCMAKGIILNTFSDLEHEVLDAMSSMANVPPVYTIGPLCLMSKLLVPEDSPLAAMDSNLWVEEEKCLEWLEGKEKGSVVYVNFGSITVMTSQQMVEFAWGLCNSNKEFLWIIRPDLVRGDNAVLPEEFLMKTKERSMLASWCSQEDVLKHPSVGGFLTHCGWNSTMETMCGGVPVICWPFFAEQQTNCKYLCGEWGIGMEIDNNVKRDEVEVLIRELMDGERGKEMKTKVLEWKTLAEKATCHGGSSFINFQRLVKQMLLPRETTN